MNNEAYVESKYWVPGYSEGDVGTPAFSPLDTVQGQYGNSPSILQLISNFDQSVNPDADLLTILTFIWDIDTAQDFGLDILGALIDLPRQLANTPFIYPERGPRGPYYMNDDQYRRAMFVKAWSNIGDHSFKSINVGMRKIAQGRGNAFASKLDTMMIKYNFYYGPQGYEYALLERGDVFIRPVGVGFDRKTIHPYFGFVEADSWNTFGQATFAAY